MLGVVASGLLMIAIARLWQPELILDEPSTQVVAESPGPTVAATPPLTPLNPFVQVAPITLSRSEIPARASDVGLCVDIRFGTFEGATDATLEAEAQLADVTRVSNIPGGELVDAAYRQVCWSLGTGREAAASLEVAPLLTIRPVTEGESAAVLLAADGRPDIRWSLVIEEPLQWNAGLVRHLPSIAATLLILGLLLNAFSSPRRKQPTSAGASGADSNASAGEGASPTGSAGRP